LPLNSAQLFLQSLEIESGQKFHLVSGTIFVSDNITMASQSIFSKSYSSSPLHAYCATIDKNANFVIDDSISTGPDRVTFITLGCTLSPSGNLQLVDSVNSCTYGYTNNPTNATNSIGFDYQLNTATCPSPAPKTENLGWIAAIVIGVVLIVVIFFAWRNKEKIKDKIGKGGQSSHSSSPPTGNRDTAADIPAPPFTVTAIADYTAVDTTQMSLTKGVQYEVVRVAEGNYWFQSKKPNGKLGWFPASYARIESD